VIGNLPVTVVYGHLDLLSIESSVGEDLKQGEKIGNLGKDKSSQISGERKYLHSGIHKGNSINIRGYVGNKTQLSNWLNPCFYLCTK